MIPTTQTIQQHRNEAISNSEKIQRRQQGRSLTIPPTSDRLSKLSSSLPPMTEKQQSHALRLQNRSLSTMIGEQQSRFQQNRLMHDQQIPLVLPYSHQHSVPINNTVALRGISQIENSDPSFSSEGQF
jgi:hypothetical protein